MCDKPLEGDSARDHCHIAGKYRDAAHSACNLKLRLNPKTTVVPVVLHNLRGYDSQLLIQAISKVEGKVSCIPNNIEKYISFSLVQLRLLTVLSFCSHLLTIWWWRTRLKLSRSQHYTSRTRQNANSSCGKVCTPTSTYES